MLQLLPNRESVKLFLRRHILREESAERDRLRCLQDCLKDPKPSHSKTWLALIIPVVYTLYILVVKITMESSGLVGIIDRNESHSKSGSRISPRYLGQQLVAPASTTTKEDIDKSLEEYWSHQDMLLQSFLLKIKMLKNERKNRFTPRPAFELTEIPITTTKINTKDHLPVCKGKNNITDARLKSLGEDIYEQIRKTLNLSLHNGLLEKLYPMVEQGGHYRPDDCWSRHKVAVLVPYRSRLDNLMTFLVNIHPFLMAQKLEYQIFVVEQYDNRKFNKGRLLNAGFKVMQKLGHWPCVIFHDVDLLPLNPRILYTCSTYPRLMSSALYFVNGSYNNISNTPRFGGVVSMTLQQYERVNGHSNLYRGWGNEDLDMYIRLQAAGLRITKNNKNISRFVQLPHPQGFNRDINWSLLLNAKHRYKNEGLSTLESKVLNVTYRHLYTHILVVLDEKPRRNIFNMFWYKLPKYHLSLNYHHTLDILKRPKN